MTSNFRPDVMIGGVIPLLDVEPYLAGKPGALLIDGIGTWLAAIMDQAGAWAEPPATEALDQVAGRIDGLIAAWRQASGLIVAVTDQVGEGLVPPYPAPACGHWPMTVLLYTFMFCAPASMPS